MTCPCDRRPFPVRLLIPAGLERIPRQIGGFPHFRRALLAGIRTRPALAEWRARDADDLGVMLLEMWAYLADSLSFYDSVIAHEAYLRTARLRPSVRRLTGLLGYLPRPAVASTVVLAAVAEGRRPVKLPAGTQFRSAAFDDEAPQIFELKGETWIHGVSNRWRIERQPARTAGEAAGWSGSGLDFVDLVGEARVQAGQALLVRGGSGSWHARRVTERERTPDVDLPTTRLHLDRMVPMAAATLLRDVQVALPVLTAGIWTRPAIGGDGAAIVLSAGQLVLDGLHRRIRPGDELILSRGSDHRWFRVESVTEVTRHFTASGIISTTNSDGDPVEVSAPPVLVPATRLTLDAAINANERKPPGAANWTTGQAAEITVRHGLVPLGEATAPPRETVNAWEPLRLSSAWRGRRLEVRDDPPTRFLARDHDEEGLDSEGTLAQGVLTLTGDAPVGRVLRTPVDVFANVLSATRGETVENEVLGSGDAAVASQAFKLAKSPLTYVPSAAADDERGVASTLTVWVDEIRWTEVPSFFGAGPDDPVYIVRQTDAGETRVTGGDGVRGRRFPSGVDNVVASYRFGAGAAAPPAGAVAQIVEPAEGLASVENPLPAVGGADAEDVEGIRVFAPRSALLLGRAVSLADFEASAAAQPGVRAVRATWRWHPRRQRPVAAVHYVGDEGIRANVGRGIRRIAEPSAAIEVERAEPVPLQLAVDVEIDSRHRPERVRAEIEAALLGEADGILTPERVGIGAPLVRSRLIERILRVEGTRAVTALLADGDPWSVLALQPGEGRYFDLEEGEVQLNLWEGAHG